MGAHIQNMRKYGVPVVVAINRFYTDTNAELQLIEQYCRENDAEFALSEVFAKGGEGGIELANIVCRAADQSSNFKPLYNIDLSVKEKLNTIATEIYGADKVLFTNKAERSLQEIIALGGDKMPVCIAKTQYSLSDDATLLGRPKNFTITIRDLRLSNGAGFVVAYAGDIMTMPGLPKTPAADKIDVENNGVILGLF